ncbi:MAG TPA: exodeoxyribonuclease V subunit alpha [Rhodanobacter sp.]|nr:exodeoxyribonuclease V subunit alpha [Rhodanobacter sp.]
MNIPDPAINDTDDRAIDQSLAHWVLSRTRSPLLASAVRAASRAEGLGHACVQLGDPQTDAGFDVDALNVLRRHDWVGDGSIFTPCVLDSRQRFYLWRNWQHETRLAAAILQRCAGRRLPISADVLATDLQWLFAGMPPGPADDQRAAVAAVAGARLFVLTGGPGTGKTTTVVRMLLMLLGHAHACGLPEQPSIALAAPTGKAAQRLAQAIAKGKAELQGSLPTCRSDFSGDDVEKSSRLKSLLQSLQQIPHTDARTLHRLLGYQPRDNSFSHDAHHPLAADIVVVDEASMVDLAMMRQLFEAMRPEAILILLGDPGQLASVEAGSVLADIVASASGNRLPPTLAGLLAPLSQSPPESSSEDAPLAGHVLTLAHSWRAGSGLQRGIEALRDKPDPDWLDALLRERADGDLQLRDCADSRQLRHCVDDWTDAHASLLQSLISHDIEAADALRQLRGLQILCALREGSFGTQGVNALFSRRLAARFDLDHRSAWYHGRPVIITRNDYARGLFNGDIGIALEGSEGLRVWFEISDRDGNTGLRSYSPRALPAHESAWAITIHRSQGSEYQDVAVVLPPEADHRLLCRELIYTAISRARRHAELWCTDAALLTALHRPIQRQGGLRERLQTGAG